MSICCVTIYYSFFFFKQKTAYEMRISDWSSDVCSSDLDPAIVDEQSPLAHQHRLRRAVLAGQDQAPRGQREVVVAVHVAIDVDVAAGCGASGREQQQGTAERQDPHRSSPEIHVRSEEHTSELQSLMRISYAVFCLKKKKTTTHIKQSP